MNCSYYCVYDILYIAFLRMADDLEEQYDDDNHEAEVEANSNDKKKHMFLKECKFCF